MFTAIDPRACAREPQSCAAIQRVLEKEPTLVYDTATGRFRHAYSLFPPSPPPPPMPPPRLVQYNLRSPFPPPPPPSAPPPWYESLEQCVVRRCTQHIRTTLNECMITNHSSPRVRSPPSPLQRLESTPVSHRRTKSGLCACTCARSRTSGSRRPAASRRCTPSLLLLHPPLALSSPLSTWPCAERSCVGAALQARRPPRSFQKKKSSSNST